MDAVSNRAGVFGLQPAQTPVPAADDTLRPTRAEAEDAVRTLLRYIGEDLTREGLVNTPARVVRSWDELFRGYGERASDHLGTVFEDVGGYAEMVLLRDIPFISHCEHHVVPIIGRAHVGYYPQSGVVGLSKIARVVEIYARRLQTQENMTAEIAQALDDALAARGVAVMIEAEHMCMTMRGVQKPGIATITTGFKGLFADDVNEQVRFFTLVRGAAAR